MRKILLTSVATAFLISCGGAETDTATDTEVAADEAAMADPMAADGKMAATDAMPTDAAGYAAKAGAGDMWEIESSRALLAKSTNADLKKFAQMMIDHHTEATAKVKAAATEANIEVKPPMLDTMQQNMLDQIKAADANAIDGIYMQHQKTAHDAALALHQGYAANGDNPALKKAASEIVPVVQKHIAELGNMKAM